jgi:DNA-directed RNA polymerase specialized sigma24 family protein
LELHHLEGHSVPEVGRRMSRSTGSVAGLLHRGLRSLRTHLGQPRARGHDGGRTDDFP